MYYIIIAKNIYLDNIKLKTKQNETIIKTLSKKLYFQIFVNAHDKNIYLFIKMHYRYII